MRKSILILAAAPLLLGAPIAHAQDSAANDTTEASDNKRFTGLRVEATVGFDRSSSYAVGHELNGMRVGGAVGYDVPIGKTFTIGAEAGIGWGVAGNTTIGFGYVDGPSYLYKVSAAHDADVSVRIGAKVSKNTLAYLKAGWADASYRYAFITPADAGTGYGHNDDGVRVGAGVEQMLGKHVYAKAEYRYTRYDEYGTDASRHQLLTGLGVRF